MVVGVTEGFRKELDIVGVGYRAAAQGKDKLDLSLGFSHPVVVEAPDGHRVRRAPADRASRCTASTSSSSARWPPNIRSLRKPEPYKGKGVRYVDERVRRKAGKAGK